MENFKSSGTFSKQAHVDIPVGLYEEEHGRDGFLWPCQSSLSQASSSWLDKY